MNSTPMASSKEKMRSATCNARYGGLDMAAGLASLNSELCPEPPLVQQFTPIPAC